MNRKTILILSIIVFGIAIAINLYIYYDINYSDFNRTIAKNSAFIEEAKNQNLSLENLIKAYKTHKTYKTLEGSFEFSNLDEFKNNLQNASPKDIKNAHIFIKYVFEMEKHKYIATSYNPLNKSDIFIKTYKEYETHHIKNSKLLEDMMKQLENKSRELGALERSMSYLTSPNMELADSYFKKIKDSKTKQEGKELKQTKEKNVYEETINKARERMLVAKEKYEKSKLDKDNKEYTELYVRYMQICQDVNSLKSFENEIKNGKQKDLFYYNSKIKNDKKYNYLYPFFIDNAVKIAIDKDFSTFLQSLLENNEINSNFKIDGIPLLFYAIEKDSKESIKILLDYAPLQEELEDGQTVFHKAAAKGNYYLVQRELEKSKDNINKETKEGKTPLYYAIKNNRYDIVALLIKSGAICDNKLKSETKIIPMLSILETGKIPEIDIKDNDSNENIALTKEEEKWKDAYEYIKTGKVFELYLLIEQGVDLTEMFINGESALDIAIHYDQFYITRLLINLFDCKKLVNLNNGMTPLHHAVLHNNTNIFYLLVDNGFDLNAIDSQGNTPLHYAVKGSLLYTDLLLEFGANPNVSNYKGNTPLHLAVLGRKSKIVDSLLKKSININQQNSDGNTPLHFVAMYYDEDIFDNFCRYESRFDCSIKNKDDKTPHNVTEIDYFKNHDPVIEKAKRDALIKAGRREPPRVWKCGTGEINRRYRYCRDNYPLVYKSDTNEEQLIAELDRLPWPVNKVKKSSQNLQIEPSKTTGQGRKIPVPFKGSLFSSKNNNKAITNIILERLENIACHKDYHKLIKEIANYDNDRDFTPLFYNVCKYNSKKSIEFLESNEIDYRYHFSSNGSFLDIAAEYGNIKLAKKALESGINIDTGIYKSKKPSSRHYFTIKDEYVSYTKDEKSGYKYDFTKEVRNYDINNKNIAIRNPNPLKIAVYFKQYEMAEFLIKNGAKVDDKLKKDIKDIKMLNILRLSDKYKFKEINNE